MKNNEALIQSMEEGRGNMLVVVRIRPLNEKEQFISKFESIKVIGDNEIVAIDPQYEMSSDDVLRNNRSHSKQYAFDFVFDTNSRQELVFEKTTRFLVKGLFSGYSATTFAYGATGAGKTFTMMGTSSSPGVVPNTLQAIYDDVLQNNRNTKITVAYIEVYNEVLRDLLSSEDTSLDLREEPGKGPVIIGMREIEVQNIGDIMTMFKVGNKNRVKEPTMANEVSSRSHAVFLMTLETEESVEGKISQKYISRLSMIDLAGSERAAYTMNKGMRMIEGANINKSLLALGNCINALSKGKKGHVPFRNSKLTRLLKDSLSGNCRTVMIANISPGVSSYEDTLNTLKYANRAKDIKTVQSMNIVETNTIDLDEYTEMIKKLQQENLELKKAIKEKSNVSRPEVDVLLTSLGNEDKALIQSLEKKIHIHFQEENAAISRLYGAKQSLTSLQQSLVQTMGSTDEATKLYKSSLNQKIDSYDKEVQELMKNRGPLIREIEGLRKKDTLFNYVNSIFEKEQIKLETFQQKKSDEFNESYIHYRDWAIGFLRNQVEMRDNILISQRQMIDQNRLSHEIKYEGLKEVSVIDSLPALPKKKQYNKKKPSFQSISKLPHLRAHSTAKQRQYELPPHLKQKINTSQKSRLRGYSSSKNLKSSEGNLSYKRRLHNALYLRNRQFSSRKRTGLGSNFGSVANIQTQRTKLRSELTLSKDSKLDKPFIPTEPALRLLKRGANIN